MGGKSKTTQTQDNSIDPWSRRQYDQSAGNVRGLIGLPYQPYEGERVAGLTGDEMQARDMFRNQMGGGTGLLDQAANQAMQAGGYRPQPISTQSFKDADMAAYMDPNTQNVIDQSIKGINRERDASMGQMNADAAKASAFGGSRHGIAQAETGRAYADVAAKTEAGLRSDAFNQAASMWQQDQGRQLNADVTNQQMGMQGAQLGLQGAGLLGQIGQGMHGMNMDNAGMLNQFGQQQRGIDQANLDAQYGEHMMGYNDRYRRAQMELGLLGGTPMIQDSTGSSTMRQSPGIGQMLGMGAQIGSMFLSDRRLKADIKPVESDDGRNWYEFRYLWSKARHVGLMAQDLLKTEPKRVHILPSGLMMVDYKGLV